MSRLLEIPALRVPLARLEALGRTNPDRHLRPFIAACLGMREAQVDDYTILRRSLDARGKPRLEFVYRLRVAVADGADINPRSPACDPADEPAHGLDALSPGPDAPREPLVVGTGPAGLMAAYLLALHGCAPQVIDRGFPVEQRDVDIAAFHRSRVLDPESNLLIGEGGAGAYSDGKLNTGVKNPRIAFFTEALLAARAPRRIRYEQHPHIGSDILPHVVRRLRERIIAWGGGFRWGSRVVDIIIRDGRCRGVVLADGSRIAADRVVLAVGHSARDLIRRLLERGIAHTAKGYQIGCRIEHRQELIDTAQYGCRPPPHLLGAAAYRLVSRPRDGSGSAASFCMCPGGEIIAGTSDPGQLSTNGMSRFARASGFANAGLIVTQEAGGPAAFEHLRELEAACFAAGGGDYSCPCQSARAFLRGAADDGPPAGGSYRLGMRPGRIDRLLPQATVRALRAALPFFERRIPGFLSTGTLVGVETRVSSPVRFLRDPDTLESSLPGLALIGEGAGQAGGIVSAALDGLTVAERWLTGVRP